MRANFDPGRASARPLVAPLAARRVSATLLASGLLELDDGELVVEFDSLGPAGADAERLAELVARLHRRGVVVHGAFTLGYDHDDEDCFARLVAWVEACGLAGVELRLWTPTPGSEPARALARAGRLRHLDYARWDGAHVIVEPAAMAPETLQRGWAWALRRLSSLRSIVRRRPSGWLGWRHVFAACRRAQFAAAESVPRERVARPAALASRLG
ncbi:hypothetical protein ACNOYE_17810 [Nannocystaceae bacterium ST9]